MPRRRHILVLVAPFFLQATRRGGRFRPPLVMPNAFLGFYCLVTLGRGVSAHDQRQVDVSDWRINQIYKRPTQITWGCWLTACVKGAIPVRFDAEHTCLIACDIPLHREGEGVASRYSRWSSHLEIALIGHRDNCRSIDYAIRERDCGLPAFVVLDEDMVGAGDQ